MTKDELNKRYYALTSLVKIDIEKIYNKYKTKSAIIQDYIVSKLLWLIPGGVGKETLDEDDVRIEIKNLFKNIQLNTIESILIDNTKQVFSNIKFLNFFTNPYPEEKVLTMSITDGNSIGTIDLSEIKKLDSILNPNDGNDWYVIELNETGKYKSELINPENIKTLSINLKQDNKKIELCISPTLFDNCINLESLYITADLVLLSNSTSNPFNGNCIKLKTIEINTLMKYTDFEETTHINDFSFIKKLPNIQSVLINGEEKINDYK